MRPLNAQERRMKLGEFLVEHRHRAFTANEIVERTKIYEGHYRYDRCFDDLKALEKRALVQRYLGRPARWGL